MSLLRLGRNLTRSNAPTRMLPANSNLQQKPIRCKRRQHRRDGTPRAPAPALKMEKTTTITMAEIIPNFRPSLSDTMPKDKWPSTVRANTIEVMFWEWEEFV